jgi:DNA-directed RNA polymerase subunit H (RpoH/RPB5)
MLQLIKTDRNFLVSCVESNQVPRVATLDPAKQICPLIPASALSMCVYHVNIIPSETKLYMYLKKMYIMKLTELPRILMRD